MRWAIPIVLLLCGGCATRTVYINTELPLPPEPVLPTITAENVACLNDETYEALVRREARLKGHIFVLRKIIEDNNRSAEP